MPARLEAYLRRSADAIKNAAVVCGTIGVIVAPIGYAVWDNIEASLASYVEHTLLDDRLNTLREDLTRSQNDISMLARLRDEVDVAYNLHFEFDGNKLVNEQCCPQRAEFYAEQGQRAYLTLKAEPGSRNLPLVIKVNGKPLDGIVDFARDYEITCHITTAGPSGPQVQHLVSVMLDPKDYRISESEAVRLSGYIVLKKRGPDASAC